MDLGLAGKVAVVTGASKGIGLAISQALVAEGVRVVAGARTSSAELDELVQAGQAQVVNVDLAAAAGPAQLVAQAGDRIDILVNNVGAARTRLDGFLKITDEDWQSTLNLDLMAAVRACRAALPVMLAAGHGVIVNVCSVNSSLPDPTVLDYSAAKAALANFSKGLSKEFGHQGIRVNTVSPGPVATALWLGADGVAASVAKATGANPADVASGAAHGSVTGRFTQPAEVASMVLVLASDRAANVTGADILIDGGLIPTW
jgi:NAD(P)-dependent dehydrogenase (short-subunit alcohol dehydrogenase family)